MIISTSSVHTGVDRLLKETIRLVVRRSLVEAELIGEDTPDDDPLVTKLLQDYSVKVAALTSLNHEGEQIVGGCWFTDAQSSEDACEWTIALDADESTSAEIIATLVHEAMHLGQYITGRLLTIKSGSGYNDARHVWRGEEMESGLSYFEQPWEAEVYLHQNEWLEALVDNPAYLKLIREL